MLDHAIRLPLFAAALAAVIMSPVSAQADAAPEFVQRDANGLAFVQISATALNGRKYIPLAEYVRLQAAGQAPMIVTMNSYPARRISPDAIGAKWNVGVFR